MVTDDNGSEVRMLQEEDKKRTEPPPEPGSIFVGDSHPEFLDDNEEVESTMAYLRKVRRFLTEAIVERYFILTNRFIKHFEGML